MPEFDSYAPGTPSWVDLGSPDIAASVAFYGGLFGWEAADQGPEGGGYHMFELRGRPVAGLGPAMNPGPPFWATYVTVADADATVGVAREAGATVLVEPMDVVDVGRFAVLMDPTGVPISLWQAAGHAGAGLANEVGAFCWNELNSRDVAGAGAFYGRVFGWEAKGSDMPGMDYTEFLLDGKSVAGMIGMTGRVPEEIPPHWLVYFGVADVDEAVARAQELGGSVFVGPVDIPSMGRFAVIGDPHGAFFGAFEFSAGQEAAG